MKGMNSNLYITISVVSTLSAVAWSFNVDLSVLNLYEDCYNVVNLKHSDHVDITSLSIPAALILSIRHIRLPEYMRYSYTQCTTRSFLASSFTHDWEIKKFLLHHYSNINNFDYPELHSLHVFTLTLDLAHHWINGIPYNGFQIQVVIVHVALNIESNGNRQKSLIFSGAKFLNTLPQGVQRKVAEKVVRTVVKHTWNNKGGCNSTNSSCIDISSVIKSTLTSPYRYENLTPDRMIDFERIVSLLVSTYSKASIPKAWIPELIAESRTLPLVDLFHPVHFAGKLFRIQDELHLVVTGDFDFSFATCDGVSTSFLELYAKPYKVVVWIFILGSTFVVIPCTVIIFEIFTSMNDVLSKIWRCAALPVTILLEIPVSLKKNLRGLSRNSKFILLLWPILALTLSSAYKGIIVSHLTKPPSKDGKWSNASEMRGFIFKTYSSHFAAEQYVDLQYFGTSILKIEGLHGCMCFPLKDHDFISEFCTGRQISNDLEEKYCEKALAQLNKIGINHIHELNWNCENMTLLNPLLSQYRKGYNIHDVIKQNFSAAVLLSYMKYCWTTYVVQQNAETKEFQSRSPYPFEKSAIFQVGRGDDMPLTIRYEEILNTSVNCKQFAYLALDSEIDAFIAYTDQRQGPTYWKGTEKVFTQMEILHVQMNLAETRKAYHSLQRLMWSGVYNIWHKWLRIRWKTEAQSILNTQFLESEAKISPKSLHMGANFRTTFYIYSIALSIAVTTLILEFLFRLLKRTRFHFFCNKIQM